MFRWHVWNLRPHEWTDLGFPSSWGSSKYVNVAGVSAQNQIRYFDSCSIFVLPVNLNWTNWVHINILTWQDFWLRSAFDLWFICTVAALTWALLTEYSIQFEGSWVSSQTPDSELSWYLIKPLNVFVVACMWFKFIIEYSEFCSIIAASKAVAAVL